MSENVGNLPSEANRLFNQLTGLREEQKALISEVGRLQDRRSAAATVDYDARKRTLTRSMMRLTTYRSKDDSGLVAARLAQSRRSKVS
jgi:hypothetical protein